MRSYLLHQKNKLFFRFLQLVVVIVKLVGYFSLFRLLRRYMLLVTPTYFHDLSVIGGGERYPVKLAETIAQSRPVRLVSFGGVHQITKQNKLEKIIYQPQFRLAGSSFHCFHLGLIKDIAFACVVHCSQYRTFTTIAVLFWAKMLGKRTLVSDYGYGANTELLKVFTPLVDEFVLISEFGRHMVEAPEQKKKVIVGGVDTQTFVPIAFGKREDYVLFVGRLLPHKGIDVLIRAIGDHRLKIVGRRYHDRYFDDLQKLARGKNVEFLSQTDDVELVELYQKARIFVLPSVYQDMYGNTHPQPELLGLVALEAMACGVPVLGSRVGGLQEIIQHGVTGYLFESGNSAELQQYIEKLFDHDELWEKMGNDAHEKVKKDYSWKVVAQKYRNQYEQR